MAKEVKKHGTGITAYAATHHTGEDVPELLKRDFPSWGKAVKDHGFFGAVTLDAVWTAEAILEGASPEDIFSGEGQKKLIDPKDDDLSDQEQSYEWYASQILRLWHAVRHEMANDKADEADKADKAARWAFQLGCRITELEMKAKWDGDAWRGYKNASTLGDNRDKKNARKKRDAKRDHALWQEIATEIWIEQPDNEDVSEVAEWVAKRLQKMKKNGEYSGSCNPGTIRRKISKPKKLSPLT